MAPRAWQSSPHSQPAQVPGSHFSPPGPPVPVPVTPQQGRPPAPQSPAMPGHSPCWAGPTSGPTAQPGLGLFTSPWRCPMPGPPRCPWLPAPGWGGGTGLHRLSGPALPPWGPPLLPATGSCWPSCCPARTKGDHTGKDSYSKMVKWLYFSMEVLAYLRTLGWSKNGWSLWKDILSGY